MPGGWGGESIPSQLIASGTLGAADGGSPLGSQRLHRPATSMYAPLLSWEETVSAGGLHLLVPSPAWPVPGGLLPPVLPLAASPFLLASSLPECFSWARAEIVLLLLLGWFPLALAASLEHIPPHSKPHARPQLPSPHPPSSSSDSAQRTTSGTVVLPQVALGLLSVCPPPCPSTLDPPQPTAGS